MKIIEVRICRMVNSSSSLEDDNETKGEIIMNRYGTKHTLCFNQAYQYEDLQHIMSSSMELTSVT